MKDRRLWALLTLLAAMWGLPSLAQTADDEIWREIDLEEMNYQRPKNYCQRLCGYYRFIDDGYITFRGLEHKLYRVYEGLFELDIRYHKDEDDGAVVMVGRDLVHPDKPGKFMEFYELKPYTFLEKARKLPKYYTLKTSGDTTRVYTKLGLAGTAVKDTVRRELRINYDALAPDTSFTFNVLIAKAHLSNVKADALYWYDETSEDYVPQGNLKRATFDGHVDFQVMGSRELFNEHTELYIDSVAYFTRDEYKADKKISHQQRRERSGLTEADIDRMKQKLGVPPLSAAVLQRMEDQRDWDEEFELWKKTDKNASKSLEPVEEVEQD